MTSKPILLVEDNPDDVALTLRALKKNQILNPISVASDGAEALKFLFDGGNTNLTEPGLILLDLKLPKVDGLEVLRRIRTPNRMTSGNSGDAVVVEQVYEEGPAAAVDRPGRVMGAD